MLKYTASITQEARMKIIAYYRVSTRKQEISGLGLEAQKAIVAEFAARHQGKILAEFTEVETGKNSDRPKLAEALSHARNSKATLVVAKLDRLARNVAFTAALMDSEVEFIACDNPHANRLTIHILAAVAENEALATSRRTKDALAAAKAKGTLLGSARPGHWKGRENKRGWKQGAKQSARVRSQRAAAAYSFLIPKIKEMKAAGDSFDTIAAKLTEAGHMTTTGKKLTAVAVWRILHRYEMAA
jgi:DNA invertase Pin-like site-specific DNA recombinase